MRVPRGFAVKFQSKEKKQKMARKGENIFKRKDGRWEARYIHHYDENGRAVYRYLYARSYTVAKEKRLRAMSEPEVAVVTSDDQTSLAFLCNKWLCDVKMSVKESTYSRYYMTVKRYIVPAMGDERVSAIGAREINAFSQQLMSRGDSSDGLSAKTVTDIIVVLKSILKYGVSDGYATGQMTGVRYPAKEPRRVSIIEDAKLTELENLLISSEKRIAVGVLISLYTGVRIGELCGLRWRDVDIENGLMRICRTVERISEVDPLAKRKTKLIICDPKTESSIRTIPLPPFLLERLRNEFCRVRASTALGSDALDIYVISGRSTPLEPHSVYAKYKRFLRANNLGDYTFHTLRHTFATRCIEAGFDAKSLSEILGHSSITTTLSIYVHPTMSQKRAQMGRLIPECLKEQ